MVVGVNMRVEHKKYYYFDEEEKGRFTDFLRENSIKMNDFAANCGISPTLLTLIVKGERTITETTIKKFAENGFEIKIDN